MIDISYNMLDIHGAKNIEKFNGFKRKNWKNFITRYDNEDVVDEFAVDPVVVLSTCGLLLLFGGGGEYEFSGSKLSAT